MARDINNTITIPKQYYVGMRKQGPDDLPLGFATPYDTTKAYEKRKSTVDTWTKFNNRTWDNVTRTYTENPGIPPTIIDNVPLPGFKIAESVRRVYWGGGNVVWRIVDPHGYELEISSSNLAKILDCSSVVNGEIVGECVWGRDKAQNVLLPVSSQPYLDAVSNTSRVGKRVPLKDVSVGDTVVLKDGTVGVYAGAFNGVFPSGDGPDQWSGGYRYGINLLNIKRKFVLLVTLTGNEKEFWSYNSTRDNNPGYQIGDSVFMFFNELHISEVTDKTTEPKNFLPVIQEFVMSVRGKYCSPGISYLTEKAIKPTDFVYAPVQCSREELEHIIIDKSHDYRVHNKYITNSGDLLHFGRSYDECELLPIKWDESHSFMEYFVPRRTQFPSYWHRDVVAEPTVVPISKILDNHQIMRVAYQINGETYVP